MFNFLTSLQVKAFPLFPYLQIDDFAFDGEGTGLRKELP